MIKNHRYNKEQLAVCRLLFCFLGCLFWLSPNVLFAQNFNQNKWVDTSSNVSMLSASKTLSSGNTRGNKKITLPTKLKEVSIGFSIIHEQLPEGYNYTPIFLITRFPIHHFKKSRFRIYAEPQFVLNNAPKFFPTTYEFGVNLGVQYFLPFSDKNGLSAAIGVGPHYLSLETTMQAKGFIFSDNFEIGYYQMLGEQLGVSIKSRFRHISNAGFQSPNIGIDNLFLMVGVFWSSK